MQSEISKKQMGWQSRACLYVLLCAAPMLAFGAGKTPAPAAEGPCSAAAQSVRAACGFDIKDEYFVQLGKCVNLTDSDQRERCIALATAQRNAAPAECDAQFEARNDFCNDAGQAPYDPVIDPAQFVDPADIGGSVAPNLYFPIVRGSHWVFTGSGEFNTVDVTSETREILGVTCAVIHDQVKVDGEVTEDTQDFFAQDRAGNVWYFGESTAEYEDGLITNIDGSFLSGRDGAKPGIAFEAVSQVGDEYRQEFLLTEAEDVARVLSTTASASVPAASCNGTCVQTEEVNANDPSSIEDKYYAPGIGVILETDAETGEHLSQLVSYHIGTP